MAKFDRLKQAVNDDLFRPAPARAVKMKVFAVRQVSGPRKCGDLVIRALSNVDAMRQWFNYYGLHLETYRHRLQVVRVPEDHPRASEAIECQHPRSANEPTIEQQLETQFIDTQEMLKRPGEVQLTERG